MATITRWRQAQTYERKFWESVSDRIQKGSSPKLAFYKHRAEKLTKRLKALDLGHLVQNNARVLEIGGGPLGILTFLPARQRIAVDPLEAYYANNETLRKLRDPGVMHLKGVGEDLCLDDERFDLVIMENCIDHVQDVDAVIKETLRVLRPGGALYLTVNCRTRPGFYVHRTLSRLNIDQGHPHTFTPERVHQLFDGQPVELEAFEVGRYRPETESSKLRANLKRVLQVTEYPVYVVARKTASSPGSDRQNGGYAAAQSDGGAHSSVATGG